MKKSKFKLIPLYSSSLTLLIITAFLFYINVYAGIGPEFEFDVILSSVALVPFVYVIFSVIFDRRISRINSNAKFIVATNIYLPFFIALHFVVLTLGIYVWVFRGNDFMVFLCIIAFIHINNIFSIFKQVFICEIETIHYIKICAFFSIIYLWILAIFCIFNWWISREAFN